MATWDLNEVLRDIGKKFKVTGKVIELTGSVGIGTWAKLDFLKKFGYNWVRK